MMSDKVLYLDLVNTINLKLLSNQGMSLYPLGEFNKDLEIPETCSFLHPNSLCKNFF